MVTNFIQNNFYNLEYGNVITSNGGYIRFATPTNTLFLKYNTAVNQLTFLTDGSVKIQYYDGVNTTDIDIVYPNAESPLNVKFRYVSSNFTNQVILNQAYDITNQTYKIKLNLLGCTAQTGEVNLQIGSTWVDVFTALTNFDFNNAKYSFLMGEYNINRWCAFINLSSTSRRIYSNVGVLDNCEINITLSSTIVNVTRNFITKDDLELDESNTSTTTTKGSSFYDEISIDNQLDEEQFISSFKLFMGEEDVTSQYVTINEYYSFLTINIPNVTDNLTISVYTTYFPSIKASADNGKVNDGEQIVESLDYLVAPWNPNGISIELIPTTKFTITTDNIVAQIRYIDGRVENIISRFDLTDKSISINEELFDVDEIILEFNCTREFYNYKFYKTAQTYSAKEISGILKATTFSVTESGNNYSVYVTLNSTQHITYLIPKENGKSLVGFNTTGLNEKIEIKKGYTLFNDVPNNTMFYPVFRDNIVIPSTFQLDLYSNKAEKTKVDKTEYLGEIIETLTGTLREECDVTNPVVRIEYDDDINFNYVFCPTLNRYYFVTNYKMIRTGLYDLYLHVDVLMTYKDDINSCVGFVARSQSNGNKDIIDNEETFENEVEYSIYPIINEIFFHKDYLWSDDYTYVFTTIRKESN